MLTRHLTLTTKNGELPTGSSQAWASWPVLLTYARTAAAAVASLIVARLRHLPDAYSGPNHDFSGHTIIARDCALNFRRTVHGNGAWRSGWSDCGHFLRT